MDSLWMVMRFIRFIRQRVPLRYRLIGAAQSLVLLLILLALLMQLSEIGAAIMGKAEREPLLNLFSPLAALVPLLLLAVLIQLSLFARFAARVVRELRRDLFIKIGEAALFDSDEELMAALVQVNHDLPLLTRLLTRLPLLLIHLLLLLGVVVVVGYLAWSIALGLLALLGLLVALMHYTSCQQEQRQQREHAFQQQLNEWLLEEVRLQPMVRSYDLKPQRQQQFQQILGLLERQQFESFNLKGQVRELLSGFGYAVVVLTLIPALWLTAGTTLSMAERVLIVLLLPLAIHSMSTVRQQWMNWQLGARMIERLEHLFGLINEATPRGGVIPPLAATQGIWLNEVSYTPPTHASLSLQGVELFIRAGERLAIVGDYNAGKRYLLRLIAGLVEPHSGMLYLDEHPYTTLDPIALRRQMGILFYRPLLLHDTVAENIRAGKPDASLEEITAAAVEAGVDTLIRQLPNGYESRIDPHLTLLTLEQQHRIALARALIAQPSVLILDNSLAELDGASERRLVETLKSVAKGRTLIAATHRLSMTNWMDRIVVLQEGQIAEQGSHDQLLARNGTYARLWLKQSLTETDLSTGEAVINMERLMALPSLAVLHLRQRLGATGLEQLRRCFITEHYPANHLIFADGAVADRFRIIARGCVEVFKQSGEQRLHIAYLNEGDYFGEGSLLLDKPRSASVQTVTSVTCLSISREQFQLLVADQPELGEDLRSVFEARQEAHRSGLGW